MSAGDGIVYGVGMLTLLGLVGIGTAVLLSLGISVGRAFTRGGGWRHVWRDFTRAM